MDLRRQALFGMQWTSLATVVTTVLSVLQLAYLGRLLASADFGLMAMVLVVIGFAQTFSDMGISNALIHFQSRDREVLSSLYWVNIAAGIGIFLLILAGRPLVISIYQEPRLNELLTIASFVFLIVPVGQQSQVLLERDCRFAEVSFASIASSLAGFFVAIGLAYAGTGVLSLIAAHLAAAVVSTVILVAIGFRDWRPKLHFRYADLKDYLAFGSFQTGERTINFLGNNLDKLLIGSLLGASQLGYYAIAYQLMSKPFQLFNPIVTRVAFPLFAKIQNEADRLRSGYLDVIRIIALVLFPVYTALIVLAEPVLQLFVGAQWLPAVPVFQVLCLLGFLYGLGNPLGSLLLAKGRADIGFYLNVLMIVLFAAAISLGASFGLVGIASGLVLATLSVLFPIGFWIRWRLIGMQPMEYVRTIWPMLAVSVLMGAVMAVVHRLLADTPSLRAVVVPVLTGSLLYTGTLAWWERETLRRIWTQRGSG